MARKDLVVQKVSFDLHTVTPLILAGANQQQEAEPRAPSLRGALRYWLRALVGGMVGTDQEGLHEVAKIEKSIFGATDSGSRVLVRTHYNGPKPQLLRRDEKRRENEGQGEDKDKATGRDYLLWSALRNQRHCIPPDAPFQVTFAVRQYDGEQGGVALQQALCAFWLLAHLGGIGLRSRRCAGSLAVEQVKQSDGVIFALPFSMPTSAPALCEQLEQGIAKLRAGFHSPRRKIHTLPSFDILHPKYCQIWVLCSDRQPWRTADQALREIGEKLHTYRSTLRLSDRRYFGLPIQGLSKERLASPLHLRLTELHSAQGKEYAGVATLFKTPWKGMSLDSYNLVEQWIDRFAHKEVVKL